MAVNLENFLEQGACIPEDLLIDYADGRLSSKQSHLVEKHLLECELCSDALEGLKMINPSKSKEAISSLNKRVDKRVESLPGKEAKIIPFRFNYKIAAVIALFMLFGGGYWYLKNLEDEKMLAQNTTPSATSVSDSASSQHNLEINSDQKSPEIISVPSAFSPAQQNAEPTGDPVPVTRDQEEGSEVEKIANDDAKQLNDNSSQVNEVVIAEKKETEDRLSKTSDIAEDEYKSAKTAPAAAESVVSYQKVTSNKKDNSYAREEKKIGQPPSAELFVKAKANFDQKKYIEASNDFEKFLNDTANEFYDDSKWFLALCYSKTNKNANARKLLKEIAHSNSIHKKEAEDLLKEFQ